MNIGEVLYKVGYLFGGISLVFYFCVCRVVSLMEACLEKQGGKVETALFWGSRASLWRTWKEYAKFSSTWSDPLVRQFRTCYFLMYFFAILGLISFAVRSAVIPDPRERAAHSTQKGD